MQFHLCNIQAYPSAAEAHSCFFYLSNDSCLTSLFCSHLNEGRAMLRAGCYQARAAEVTFTWFWCEWLQDTEDGKISVLWGSMEFSSLLLTPEEMVGLILQTVHRELLRDALLTKTVFGHFLQKMLPRVSCGISCQSSTFWNKSTILMSSNFMEPAVKMVNIKSSLLR